MSCESLLQRELGGPLPRLAASLLPSAEWAAARLDVEAVLSGHAGCVNRLAWNQEGSMLASASDDCQVLLWHYPDTQRVPLALQTQHTANLFGVAFLPFSSNCRVVSGGMDSTVQLHELEGGAFNIPPKFRRSSSSRPPAMRRHPPPPAKVHTVVPRTTVYKCHKSRVKEVEVCPADPTLFWSAGEDGAVRQYDTRLAGQKTFSSPNVLVSLATAGDHGRLVECKGLTINPLNPALLAVACGDAYVRVYDRRMLATGPPAPSRAPPALLQLSAPHLAIGVAKHGLSGRCHATHCSFSNRGDRLVASFHGDHAYVFDVTRADIGSATHLTPLQQQLQQRRERPRRRSGDGCSLPWRAQQQQQQSVAGVQPQPQLASQEQQPPPPQQQQQQQQQQQYCRLSEAAEASKVLANNALFEQAFPAAVQHFSAAIALAPSAAGLYTQRALALLKRGWEGDAAYALLDCETALLLLSRQGASSSSGGSSDGSTSSGSGVRSHQGGGSVEQQARLRVVHALKQLGQVQCALAALDSYKALYPAAAASAELDSLQQLLTEHQKKRRIFAAGRRFGEQEVLQLRAERARRAAARQPCSTDPQQQGASTAAAAAGAAAGAGAGGLDGRPGNDAGTSRSASPLGARAAQPPGRGVRVDTDVDSDDVDGIAGSSPAAAAAAAASGRRQQQQRLEASAAGAAAAGDAPQAPGTAAGPAVAEPHYSQHWTSDEEYDEEDEASDDMELLLPWYGSRAFAAEAAAATQQQQQQQQQRRQGAEAEAGCQAGGSAPSSGRRRPRSDAADAEQQPEPEPGMRGAAADAPPPQGRVGAAGVSAAPSSSSTQHGAWWDELSGGRGRLSQRCVGHCNVQTDIKEAVFLGQDDALVAAGSDDGCVFIYDAANGAVVRVLAADDDVANCVRPHPCLPVLATSGIETVVRLWAPTGVAADRTRSHERSVAANQMRMRDGPQHLRGGVLPPQLLQGVLNDPQLLQLLLQRLDGRPAALAGGGAAGGGAAAGGGPRSEGHAAAAAADAMDGDDASDGGSDGDETDDVWNEDGGGAHSDGGGEDGGQRPRQRRRRHQPGEVECRVA